MDTDSQSSLLSPELTTHDYVLALLNAVGALSLHLTGQYLNLCVEDGAGNYRHIYSDGSRVWFTDAPVPPTLTGCAWHDNQPPKES